MYRAGDKIQIKTWEELAKEYQVTEYRLVMSEAVNLPDGFDFGRTQDDKINERCTDRIDIIEHVDKERGWYYLALSKTIITKYVIKCEVLNVTDVIDNRFDILDL
jgi:hypothetical protein